MPDNIPQFIKDFRDSFVFVNATTGEEDEPTGPFDEGQCIQIGLALTSVFRNELRERVLESLRRMEPPLTGSFADQPDHLQMDVDNLIQTQFLYQPRLIECALQALTVRHTELNIDGLPGLLAEGYVCMSHAQPRHSDPAVQAAADAIYTENLGMSKPEAIRNMVELSALKFPDIANQIVHEYGTRMQAREVEQGIARETRTRR